MANIERNTIIEQKLENGDVLKLYPKTKAKNVIYNGEVDGATNVQDAIDTLKEVIDDKREGLFEIPISVNSINNEKLTSNEILYITSNMDKIKQGAYINAGNAVYYIISFYEDLNNILITFMGGKNKNKNFVIILPGGSISTTEYPMSNSKGKIPVVGSYKNWEYVTPNKEFVGLGNVENKTLDQTVTQGSENYVSSNAVYIEVQKLVAIAGGKTSSYVVSIANDPIFAVGKTTSTSSLTLTASIQALQDNNTYKSVSLSDLHVGDSIYVIESNYKDWWVGSVSATQATLYVLETEKEDLTIYQTKSDNNLTTTSKNVVGAINELVQSLAQQSQTIPADLEIDNNKLILESSTGTKIGNGVDLDDLLKNVGAQGTYSAVQVDTKGRVITGKQSIEVGTVVGAEPSANLVVGGIFFELVEE